MNPISAALNSATHVSTWQDRLFSAVSRPVATPAPTTPSVFVTLTGSEKTDDVATYAAPGNDASTSYSNDALQALLERNAPAADAAGQFAGLGKALLTRLGDSGDDVSLSSAASSVSGPASLAPPMSASGTSDASLSVKTARGATVDITLHRGDDGSLSIDMKSSQALSETERQSVSKLAGAFQDALDGLSAQPPQLDLEGLTRTDPSIASVDLHTRIDKGDGTPAQTIDFHSGADTRSLKTTGPDGTVDLSIDMRSPALWGNQDQRQAAVANYLAQIDDASRRGHADASLTSLFKDAFGQMNAYYPPSPHGSTASPPAKLSDADHAMLTGLADFTASVSQASTSPNPLRPNEKDGFAYQLSQQSNIGGTSAQERTIDQTQSAHLTASYHQSLSPDIPLQLTNQPGSQSYLYRQIDDSSESDTHIAYTKGQLTSASVTRSANQSTHDLTYVLNQLVDDVTNPSRQSRTDDLLAMLKPLLGPDGQPVSPQALDTLHRTIGLQSEPYLLASTAKSSH